MAGRGRGSDNSTPNVKSDWLNLPRRAASPATPPPGIKSDFAIGATANVLIIEYCCLIHQFKEI